MLCRTELWIPLPHLEAVAEPQLAVVGMELRLVVAFVQLASDMGAAVPRLVVGQLVVWRQFVVAAFEPAVALQQHFVDPMELLPLDAFCLYDGGCLALHQLVEVGER